MANAAKRMKEKKARQLADLIARKNKAKGIVVEEVVEEIVEDVVDIDSGTVTDIDVVDEGPEEGYTEEELNGMLRAELVEIADELGVDTDGKKVELIEKILNA